MLFPIIAKRFSTLTAGDVVARLDKARIANAKMNDMADLWAHPQFKATAQAGIPLSAIMLVTGKVVGVRPPAAAAAVTI